MNEWHTAEIVFPHANIGAFIVVKIFVAFGLFWVFIDWGTKIAHIYPFGAAAGGTNGRSGFGATKPSFSDTVVFGFAHKIAESLVVRIK